MKIRFLALSGFLAYASLSSLFPIIPKYAVSIGATEFLSGFIAGAFAVVTAALMIPFGFLSQKFGERNFMVLGLGIYVISPLLYSISTSPAHLLFYRFLNGFGVAMFIPSINAFASGIADARKGEVFGILTTSYMLGFVAGPVAGGYICAVSGFSNAFYFSSLLALFAFLPILFLKDRVGSERDANKNGVLMVERKTFLASLIVFSSTFGSAALALFAFPLYPENFGVNDAAAGLMISNLFFFSAISRIPAGKLADRFGMVLISIAGIAIEATAIAISSLIVEFQTLQNFITVFIVSAVCGGGSGFANTPAFAMASMDRNTGTAMGLVNSFLNLGIFLGPLLSGYAAESFPLNTVLAVVSVLCLSIPLLAVRMWR